MHNLQHIINNLTSEYGYQKTFDYSDINELDLFIDFLTTKCDNAQLNQVLVKFTNQLLSNNNKTLSLTPVKKCTLQDLPQLDSLEKPPMPQQVSILQQVYHAS